MSDLARQSSEIVMWTTQPQKFLALIGLRLSTYAKAYRTKLPADEMEMWRESLKDYTVQEFDDAMRELLAHPPKFELDDGTIQVWRGMPKLPDVIHVMLEGRAKSAAEFRRQEDVRFSAEMKELKRRQAAGEKFYGLADVLKTAPSEALKPMPSVKTVWADIDPDRNKEKLDQQKLDLTK